jgi:DNA-binding NarL/FixJ family response regulator
LPHTERINPSRYKAVKEALSMTEKIAKDDASKSASVSAKNDNLAVFQRFFDETAMQALPNVEEVANKPTRNESILALAEEGKTDAQIASELGITQNEVRLIIGLTVRK